jgi:hypothetical protein
MGFFLSIFNVAIHHLFLGWKIDTINGLPAESLVCFPGTYIRIKQITQVRKCICQCAIVLGAGKRKARADL